MRTTLDIDDRVVAAAKSRARVRRITMGQALSELALKGFEAESRESEEPGSGDEFPMLPPVAGHVITDEMVQDALADA